MAPAAAEGEGERADRQPGPRIVKLVKFSKSGNHRATVKKVKVFGNERVTAGGRSSARKRRAASVKKKRSGQVVGQRRRARPAQPPAQS